jgi:hypothetical protein
MPLKTTAKRAVKWNESHKARFRQLIHHGKINPKKSDLAYIEKVRAAYFKDRPVLTFRNNWKTSTAEWRIGQAIEAANKAKAERAERKAAGGESRVSLGLIVACESYSHHASSQTTSTTSGTTILTNRTRTKSQARPNRTHPTVPPKPPKLHHSATKKFKA